MDCEKDKAQQAGSEAGEEEAGQKEKKQYSDEDSILEAEELDALGSEMETEREADETDKEYRRRMAVKFADEDSVKCLQAVFAKRKGYWHQDERYLHDVFKNASSGEKERFIDDYLNREEMSEEVEEQAGKYKITFPKTCVLRNELREVMVWLLSSCAPWERDPCLGCSYCMLGKIPEEAEEGQNSDEA